ncbi:hypothetical protein [Nocardia sp. BMG51109]|uniref:hypothetical protein n=1 Tax=Nocardia sp. BMG51109 TaxID=1056816 RepID=UPI000466C92D|nr:hypothetical protein [Nocardia sp. BMG51109]
MAYAIVRQDISGDLTDEHVRRLRQLATAEQLDLRGILLAEDDAPYAQLFASFEASRITVLLLPDLRCVNGWQDVIRHQVEVLTLAPRKRWERLPEPDAEDTVG